MSLATADGFCMHAGWQHETLQEKIFQVVLSSFDAKQGKQKYQTVHENLNLNCLPLFWFVNFCLHLLLFTKYSDVRATSLTGVSCL